jgi:hypothetical protein
MTIMKVGITGLDSGDFAQTNNCGPSLAVGASCAISVTFSPTNEGNRVAAVKVTDSAPGGAQDATLLGYGVFPAISDFTLTANSPTTQTVTPGQAANYAVTVSPVNGFNHSVSLSCSGAPSGSKCTVTPNSVTLDGSDPVTASVAVVTAGTSMGLTQPSEGPPSGSLLASWLAFSGTLGLMLIASSARWRRQWNPRRLYALAFVCLLSIGLTQPACGGGGNSSGGGTPAGTYTLTVTGSFGSGSTTLTHATQLTLVVQ